MKRDDHQVTVSTEGESSSQRSKVGSQLGAMKRITRELSATLDMSRLLDVVLQEAAGALNASAGYVVLQDSRSRSCSVKAHLGVSAGHATRLNDSLRPGVKAIPALAENLAAGQTRIESEIDRLEDWGLSGLEPAPRSVALAPIYHESAALGLIVLFATEPAHFIAQDAGFLEVLASYASVAIGNEWRYKELVQQRDALHRRTEQLSHLFRITQDARTDRRIEEVLEDAAYSIQDSVGFNIAMFSVVEGDPPVVRRVAAAGLPLKIFEKIKAVQQPASTLRGLLKDRYRIGNQTYLFPYDQKEDWGVGIDIHTFVPLDEPIGERDWHPEDMLLIPLWGKNQDLLGVLSVDDPGTD